MRPSKLFIVGLFLSVGACGVQDCVTGQTVTLVYNGSAEVNEGGHVMLDEHPIGFIDAMERQDDGLYLMLRIREAGLLHERDAFIGYRGNDGRVGLRVEYGGGAPLVPGAVIYYPEREDASEEEALPDEEPEPAPQPEPEIAMDGTAGRNIEDAEDDGPVVTFEEDTFARRSVRNTLGLVKGHSGFPPELREQVEVLQRAALRPGDERQILGSISRELPVLRKNLAATARDANRRGDRQTARAALEAVQKTVVLEQRLNSQVQRVKGRPENSSPFPR